MISAWWQTTWDWQSPPLQAAAPQGQREFEIEFFEGIVARQADYWEALSVLANHYTSAKRYADGLAVDERLAHLRPQDAVVYYNLACSYSLVGEVPNALEALEKSLDLGYRDFLHIMRDKDLSELRKDRRFKHLLSRYVKTV
jgi:tetratricopeptide (TPR) repeat protein